MKSYKVKFHSRDGHSSETMPITAPDDERAVAYTRFALPRSIQPKDIARWELRNPGGDIIATGAGRARYQETNQ